jgi:hypothetical protein
MGLAQLLVLHLQLDLVHLQFMQQGIGGPARWHGGGRVGQFRFGTRA